MKVKIIVFLAAFAVAFGAQAETCVTNGIEWTYTVSDGKASIGGGEQGLNAVPKTTAGEVIIPSTLGGYPVTSIGAYAFSGCSSLTSVTIPDTVTSIGGFAFVLCESLTSVTLPDSLTRIGSAAFCGCSSLTSVTIPDSITSIGDLAFGDCPGLADSNGFVIVRGVLYEYYGEGGDVTIPDGVTSIGYEAFSGCSSLTSMTIPDSVTSIGDWAFSGCSSLTRVLIPVALREQVEFGDVFSGCSEDLEIVYYPMSCFKISTQLADEGGIAVFKVCGGNVTKQSSVQVQLAYNTAVAADLDLANGVVRREGDNAPSQMNLKFPLTLTWEAGEIGEKVISIPVKTDKAIEADEFFTLQLANPKNMVLGDADVCTVTIHDPGYDELKAKIDNGTAIAKEITAWNKLHPGKAYVRPLASPATGGKVTGGALVVPGKAARLKATALAGFVFAGWYTNAACAVGQELTGYGDYRNPSLAYTATNINVDVFARFIPVEEDYLSLGEDFLPLQIRTNALVSIYVPVESASLPDIKVSGLPSGLKFYAKETLVRATKTTPAYTIPANTIYGTAPKKPTAKPATGTVTVKNAGKYAITRKYSLSIVDGETRDESAEVVSDAPHFYSLAVDLSDDFAGKVTGPGVYQAGKKVTARATANKGFVFNGWYDGDLLVTQAASYAFTMPDEDVAFVAKFVTAAEDAGSISLTVDALGGQLSDEGVVSVTNLCGVALKWPVAVDALSQPVVAVSGLPSGLKFTAKDIVDCVTKEVTVPANTIYGAPTAESKLDARTGLRKPSVVKFTVTTAGKSKRIYPVEMTVLPLPAWAVGTFNGGGDYGQVSLTVAKTGKLSGKYLSDGLTWSLAANSFDSIDKSGEVYRATLIGKSGKLAMTNEVGVACDSMGGFAESLDYIAYRNNWKLEPWKTIGKPFAKAAALEYEDTASVEGEEVLGVISLKFAAAGTVRAAGSFVVGVNEHTGKDILYKASGSAVLAPQTEPDENGAFEGVVFIYFPPKAGKFDGYVRCIDVRWTGESWIKQ